ncbi:MAG: RluA family pseudouridine synthase [Burkholderiales bacterium]|nr:RluA family pseudouridine synthase [Burkholderiales bacterium]
MAQAAELRVIHEDEDMLVLDKPTGLLSVPGRGPDKQDCLSLRVQALYPNALVVHRLDMATSGLILFARGPVAQRALSLAFAERRITKRYVAMVAGHLATPAQEWGVIDLPIGADWHQRPLRKIDYHLGKASVTRWRVLAARPDHRATRLELEPQTGRSHQLRVHLLALGHPILGDALYGTPEVQGMATRLLLHASSLAFKHPVSMQSLQFASAADF